MIISGPGISLQGLRFDPKTQHRDQIFGFIFTSTSMTKESIIEYLQNYNQSTDRRYWMNVFCALAISRSGGLDIMQIHAMVGN